MAEKKSSRFLKDLILTLWENPWLRLVVFVLVLVQISSFFAHRSEKAFQKDMEWERPPDRLPDLVDMTIKTQNQEARMNQALRNLDRMIGSKKLGKNFSETPEPKRSPVVEARKADEPGTLLEDLVKTFACIKDAFRSSLEDRPKHLNQQAAT